MAAIAGGYELTINGRKYPVEGEVTCKGKYAKKEILIGPKGEKQGHKTTWEPAYCKGNIRITPDIDVENDIYNIEDAKVEVTLPDGRIFSQDEAVYAEGGEYSSDAALVPFEFQSADGWYTT